MRSLWADKYELREACDNTLLIAERCEVSFTEGADLMPQFPVPGGRGRELLVRQGGRAGAAAARYPTGIPADVRARADYEVAMILQMGFPGYFLVVADLIGWAREQGIRVGPGRGSAAGSLVAYAMRITELDPLRHGLLFERFLNPERVSMPDIDIDFDERRRGEVMSYVTDKYGDDRVAQVVTYGTIKAKQAVKDSARVLGYPFSMGERITKAMPAAVMGKDVPAQQDLRPVATSATARAASSARCARPTPRSSGSSRRRKGLEGLKRQWGVHACAVIMSSEPLIDTIPIMKREQDGAIITQFDYPTCEALGLLKMDFLGLRNLTVIDDALANIQRNRGETVVIEDLGLRRPGDLRRCWPAATPSASSSSTAARCGRCCARCARTPSTTSPRSSRSTGRARWGRTRTTTTPTARTAASRWSPIHPELDEPLREVLGRDLRPGRLPGAGHGDRPAGRRLLARPAPTCCAGRWARRRRRSWRSSTQAFSAGMAERGFSAAAVKALWDVLLPFCDYGFNKSHGAGYAVVSYWTAYLKANYPAEYMAALLTSVRDDKDKSADLPGRVPAHGHQGAAAVRERLRRRLHPDRHRHPLRPDRHPQRRRNVVASRGLGAQGARARSPTSATSCARSTRWCATSGPSRR